MAGGFGGVVVASLAPARLATTTPPKPPATPPPPPPSTNLMKASSQPWYKEMGSVQRLLKMQADNICNTPWFSLRLGLVETLRGKHSLSKTCKTVRPPKRNKRRHCIQAGCCGRFKTIGGESNRQWRATQRRRLQQTGTQGQQQQPSNNPPEKQRQFWQV